jgi:hypothetical protein
MLVRSSPTEVGLVSAVLSEVSEERETGKVYLNMEAG